MKTISIVTPCYNEEDNLRICCAAVRDLFETRLKGYRREHIFCDNASTDSSAAILREMAAEDPCIRVIFNARNFGPLRNTYNGVMAARGDAVLLFLPADLQDPPELLPEFVALWEQGYEIVFGIRAQREEGFIMRNVRALYYQVLTRLAALDVPPGVGDFQLVDRRIIEAMRNIRDSYPFMRMMPFECGGRAVGVPYTWRARKIGVSRNRLLALVDQGLNGFITFTSAPLRLGMACGFALSIASMGYALLNLIIGLIHYGEIAAPGIMTLIVAIFFFSGVQLFFTGLIGEYILSIHGQVRQRPVVFERERLNFEPDDTSEDHGVRP